MLMYFIKQQCDERGFPQFKLCFHLFTHSHVPGERQHGGETIQALESGHRHTLWLRLKFQLQVMPDTTCTLQALDSFF